LKQQIDPPEAHLGPFKEQESPSVIHLAGHCELGAVSSENFTSVSRFLGVSYVTAGGGIFRLSARFWTEVKPDRSSQVSSLSEMPKRQLTKKELTIEIDQLYAQRMIKTKQKPSPYKGRLKNKQVLIY
jgi:hypothetical protein